MTKVATDRLILLLDLMSTSEALGADTMSQARTLLAILSPDEQDVTEVRQALDAVEAKKAKGILYTFYALGKQICVQARQNLSETSADESLSAVVAHLKDLTIALNATTPSDGWLVTAKTMVENIGQIGRAGSRSLKHRVRPEIASALFSLRSGVVKVNSDCSNALDQDVSERVCSIEVAAKDYGALMQHMVGSLDKVPSLDQSLLSFCTQLGQEITEPVLTSLAAPFMENAGGDVGCWKVLAKATVANEKKYHAWSSLLEAVRNGCASHAEIQLLASVYNTHGYDSSSVGLKAFLSFCVRAFCFVFQI